MKRKRRSGGAAGKVKIPAAVRLLEHTGEVARGDRLSG